mmetsp:Transcript_66526/g.173097  ORF Transcript_66526/g.173097 Transcript_66526/m.173097 type:complete len:238 (+) Transcript_66526:117-830(+)
MRSSLAQCLCRRGASAGAQRRHGAGAVWQLCGGHGRRGAVRARQQMPVPVLPLWRRQRDPRRPARSSAGTQLRGSAPSPPTPRRRGWARGGDHQHRQPCPPGARRASADADAAAGGCVRRRKICCAGHGGGHVAGRRERGRGRRGGAGDEEQQPRAVEALLRRTAGGRRALARRAARGRADGRLLHRGLLRRHRLALPRDGHFEDRGHLPARLHSWVSWHGCTPWRRLRFRGEQQHR